MARLSSKTQVDRLGERLKKEDVSAADLESLDAYRRTFHDAYETVIQRLRLDVRAQPTGRPAKSTRSIANKLRREHIRLTQINDIAGCRVVVRDVLQQDRVARKILASFSDVEEIDRRLKPSNGYRAVHLIVAVSGKRVEIQLRTAIQHLWAEVSEKLSDLTDASLKYGRGPKELQELLMTLSVVVEGSEKIERNHAKILRTARTKAPIPNSMRVKVLELVKETRASRRRAVALFRRIIDEAPEIVKNR